MQDSMQLPSSQGQPQNHNQFHFNEVVSPKGRRLTKGGFGSINTASHESLAYSNSTYNKNQLTQRSPPLFNIDYLNNQNINTMNLGNFDRKEATFGSTKGLIIQFDKIKQESYLSNFDDQNNSNQRLYKQPIELPCFLSNENSPNKFIPQPVDSLNQSRTSINQSRTQYHQQQKQTVESSRKYVKINPSIRKQVKQADKLHIGKGEQKGSKVTKLIKSNNNTENEQSYSSLPKNQRRSKSPLQTLTKSPPQTRNEDETLSLKQKIKQLQYSLQVESISTQELRTKVNVLNQLLEQKFLQKNGINFKLFRNSSPNITRSKKNQSVSHDKDFKTYSNIDLYVQMKIMQKSKQEMEIQFERMKTEFTQKSNKLDECTMKCQQLQQKLMLTQKTQKTKHETKTQTSFRTDQNQRLQNLSYSEGSFQRDEFPSPTKVKQLQQERQTLIEYIQTQKKLLQQKDFKIKELSSQIQLFENNQKQNTEYLKLLEEKQKRFLEVQRPKMLSQINELTQKIDSQKQQMEKLEMENNLRQLQLSQSLFRNHQFNSSPEGKTAKTQNQQTFNHQSPAKTQQRALTIKHTVPTSPNQQHQQDAAVPDAMSLIMLQQQELKMLKNERDYFREQYESLKQLEQQNYNLRLKNEDLQNQLSSLHQLIEVDDQITF